MLFETVPYLISGVPLKFSAPAVPIAETRQVILTRILRAMMRIINSKYDATTISAQETSLVARFNLILDATAYAEFKVPGVLGTDSLISPSYTMEEGFSWHISLAISGT